MPVITKSVFIPFFSKLIFDGKLLFLILNNSVRYSSTTISFSFFGHSPLIRLKAKTSPILFSIEPKVSFLPEYTTLPPTSNLLYTKSFNSFFIFASVFSSTPDITARNLPYVFIRLSLLFCMSILVVDVTVKIKQNPIADVNKDIINSALLF